MCDIICIVIIVCIIYCVLYIICISLYIDMLSIIVHAYVYVRSIDEATTHEFTIIQALCPLFV